MKTEFYILHQGTITALCIVTLELDLLWGVSDKILEYLTVIISTIRSTH